MAGKRSRIWLAVGLVGGLWIVLRATKPRWYQDLMLRAFASDQLAEPGKSQKAREDFEKAADLAARAMLPLGWVVKIAEISTGVTLEQAVQAVQKKVLAMGPPADSRPETLAAYRSAALSAAQSG